MSRLVIQSTPAIFVSYDILNSSGQFKWYPKRGVKPSIDTTATGITILTDAEGGNMLAADLFGAGAIDWLAPLQQQYISKRVAKR